MNNVAIAPPAAPPGYSTRMTAWFLQLAGGLLTFNGTATLITILQKPQMTALPDPVLGISVRWLMLGVGLAELLLALLCLFTRKRGITFALLAWLALNLIVYWFGLWSMGWPYHYGYVGPLVNSLDISPFRAGVVMLAVLGFLLLGSGIAPWLERRSKQAAETLKMSCPSCGVHIRFANQNVGQKTSCPQCKAAITLRKPDLLKMTCFFCQEHIEFPSHAIGEKMPCPHCKMDITLKEPV
jgi:RNase P subunit RPR2